eukprot:CAMPEP_0117760282 /NCGR_PEP_ID=MMETSP0947-20121206/16532_1 /TAXON_ID=44440 /ORGANISM="Chattonella subsalsa, Strain CCMP2191" /LENGTH=448 /DNA_ID=CAMNT_0005580933 /DNA_START=57 /DNA_END=1403 /DNA_ORIENTATION=-
MKGVHFLLILGLILKAVAAFKMPIIGERKNYISILSKSKTIPLKATLEPFDPVTPFISLPQPKSDFLFSQESLAGIVNGLAVDEVIQGAKEDNGWLSPLVAATEFSIKGIHGVLDGAGVPGAYGLAIVAFTCFVKLLTYPLTRTQLESTTKMQAIAPKVKELQAKYANNPEVANQKIAQIYQDNNVNPLAGCVPALIQIPVFISLYRALLNLAAENVLNEPFLWLPSLEGPTFGADPTEANAWLFKNWANGAPSLGWTDTLLYLTIPVILIVSQSISTQLMQPKTAAADDPAQQQSQIILKVLPFLIGWFSINVPAGLGVYWIVNNFVTTALTLFIRGQVEAEMAAAGPSREVFNPPKQTPPGAGPPKGFGSPANPATPLISEPQSVVEAEVVDGSPTASTESSIEEESSNVEVKLAPSPEGFSSSGVSVDAPPNKKRANRKKKKGKK